MMHYDMIKFRNLKFFFTKLTIMDIYYVLFTCYITKQILVCYSIEYLYIIQLISAHEK